jgi:hypothetical protein
VDTTVLFAVEECRQKYTLVDQIFETVRCNVSVKHVKMKRCFEKVLCGVLKK